MKKPRFFIFLAPLFFGFFLSSLDCSRSAQAFSSSVVEREFLMSKKETKTERDYLGVWTSEEGRKLVFKEGGEFFLVDEAGKERSGSWALMLDGSAYSSLVGRLKIDSNASELLWGKKRLSKD